MKRIFGVLAILLLAIGLFPTHNAAALNTNNFRITSYDIQYELSRDSEGRSVLKTVETITAAFPSFDQNHGIERAIPARYDGHSTSLAVQSVTNAEGTPLSYGTRSEGDMTILRIGDADTYVHGVQTYKISYTQRDVTHFYQDTNRDEWYWDTNGTEWQVPIDQLTASMTFDKGLVETREGAPACYQGLSSGADACTIASVNDTSYTLEATSLAAGENVTVAFGFEPDTFMQYAMSPTELFWLSIGIIQAVSVFVSIALAIIFGFIWHRRSFRKKEEHPIVAEYIPPKNASVMVASKVLTAPTAVFSAQLIDLAVRHFISIIQTKEKSLWRQADYDIVVASNLASLRDEEKELLRDMFGKEPKIGDRVKLSGLRNNAGYSMRTLDNDKKLKQLIEGNYAIREKSPQASRLFYRWAIALLIVGVLTLSIPFGLAALVLWLYGFFLRPLTDKGLAIRRYVLGLDKYIKASEVDRLKFLQGPDTAQKVGYIVDPDDPGELVKLYERVLPYAILFGRESEWAQRLGDVYDRTHTAPDWYTGTTAFNAVVFASSLDSFSTAASYSGGSSSSSSGGSSGGGSSGGGGGGGGGGGW